MRIVLVELRLRPERFRSRSCTFFSESPPSIVAGNILQTHKHAQILFRNYQLTTVISGRLRAVSVWLRKNSKPMTRTNKSLTEEENAVACQNSKIGAVIRTIERTLPHGTPPYFIFGENLPRRNFSERESPSFSVLEHNPQKKLCFRQQWTGHRQPW